MKMIYLEMGASVISIVASLATIVSYLKTRKKEDSSKTPVKHNES